MSKMCCTNLIFLFLFSDQTPDWVLHSVGTRYYNWGHIRGEQRAEMMRNENMIMSEYRFLLLRERMIGCKCTRIKTIVDDQSKN